MKGEGRELIKAVNPPKSALTYQILKDFWNYK